MLASWRASATCCDNAVTFHQCPNCFLAQDMYEGTLREIGSDPKWRE